MQNLPYKRQVWLWNSFWLDNHYSRPMTYYNHPIPSISPIRHITLNELSRPKKVKKIPGNTRSYFSTLLPDPNSTRYPVFCPIPDPILKNPTRWALTAIEKQRWCGDYFVGWQNPRSSGWWLQTWENSFWAAFDWARQKMTKVTFWIWNKQFLAFTFNSWRKN